MRRNPEGYKAYSLAEAKVAFPDGDFVPSRQALVLCEQAGLCKPDAWGSNTRSRLFKLGLPAIETGGHGSGKSLWSDMAQARALVAAHEARQAASRQAATAPTGALPAGAAPAMACASEGEQALMMLAAIERSTGLLPAVASSQEDLLTQQLNEQRMTNRLLERLAAAWEGQA